MRTNLKSQTARTNGAQSRGPVTPQGRAASSRNSLRHGLTAKTIVLPHESQDDFDLLLDSYLDQFRPRTGVELDLVEAMAAARWRLRRLAAIETSLLDNELGRCAEAAPDYYNGLNDDQRLAMAFKRLANMGQSLTALNRYEATLNRAYDRALRELLILQKHTAPTAQPEPAQPEPVPPKPPEPPDPAGVPVLGSFRTTLIPPPIQHLGRSIPPNHGPRVK